MAGFLKRAQLYLGLGDDDEYEDYDDYDERSAPVVRDPRPARESYDTREELAPARPAPARPVPARPASPAPGRPAAPRPAPPSTATRTVREPAARTRPVAPPSPPESEVSAVRTLPPKDRTRDVPPAPKPKPVPVVRQVSANAKPSVVSPASFNDAQEVADKFKASQPVILNLQGTDKDLARRLLDFCSGICYALSGHMEKVAARVYLLTPPNVEVSAEERRRLQERGLNDG